MRCFAMLTLLGSLLACAPALAQSSTLTIPLTVPPPAPLTVTLPPNTTVTANSTTYLVTGTLTLTPMSSTPGPIAPPPAPVTVGPLTFGGYRDRSRNPTTTVAAGDRLIIQGGGFGVGALVTIGGVPAPVLTQSDTELTVTVPNVPGPAPVTVNGVPDPFPLTVTPQAALLPGTAPGDLPPHDWPPFVTEFRNSLGAHLETATLGAEIVLAGNTFGDQGGVIWLGNEQLPFSSWADGEIHLTLDPLTLAPVEHATVWTIERSGGAMSTAFGPAIKGG